MAGPMAANISTSRPECHICGKSFQRLEHVKRHISIHTTERPLQCGSCGKSFNRKDALNRHERIHRVRRPPSKKFRACSNCALARVKCSGAQPCTRCSKKGVDCLFPTHSGPSETSPTQATTEGHDDSDSGLFHEMSNQSSNDADTVSVSGSRGVTNGGEMVNQRPTQTGLEGQSWSGVPLQDQTGTTANLANMVTWPPPNPATDRFSEIAITGQVIGQEFPAVDPSFQEAHILSASNWLSPSFDFSLEDLQYPVLNFPTLSNVRQPTEWPAFSPATIDSAPGISESTEAEEGRTTLTDAEGSLYVDGTGARRPRNGRYAESALQQIGLPQGPSQPWYSSFAESDNYMFPEEVTFEGALTVSDGPFAVAMSPAEYEQSLASFHDLCLSSRTGLPVYVSTRFPASNHINRLLEHYWKCEDPAIFPLVHHTLRESAGSWVLKLAMAAIGSQYDDSCQLQTTIALHEYVRRILQKEEYNTITGISNHTLAINQAKLLNVIGMMYSGSQKLETHKLTSLSSLADVFQIFCGSSNNWKEPQESDQETKWKDWILLESARRLCHCIWLLDAMSKYHFGSRPRLGLDFANLALPCPERVWEAKSSQLWCEVHEDSVALEKALRVLYVEKRLLSGIGDFAQVILIHGLYYQTWEVASSIERPLLRWTPSARKGNAESDELTQSVWLPKSPLYARWRNSACDCLDILHWTANSDTWNSGTENTTVLNLHLARIVLLTPYEAINQLVQSLVSNDPAHTAENIELVRKWVIEDQYKARLAMIHCGVLFWHIRRYSTDAFYEPADVYMATLGLWAYGCFCPRAEKPRHHYQGDDTDSASDSATISSIRLDRPTDDELVQMFVKRGRSMTATIAGVGNITSPRGPTRMLKEGCKLLGTLKKWSIRDRYIAILGQLAAM